MSLLAPEIAGVVKKQEVNQVEVHSLSSYRKRLEEFTGDIKEMERHLAGVQYKYLTILKCLTVLLDLELLGVVILRSSYAHRLLNYETHRKLDYDSEILKDALGCFQEIKDTKGALKPEEGKEDFNYGKEQAKLKKVICGSDHLLMTSYGEVEEAINQFLCSTSPTTPPMISRSLLSIAMT